MKRLLVRNFTGATFGEVAARWGVDLYCAELIISG